MNRLKIAMLSHKLLIVAVGILAVGAVAFAYSGETPKVVVEGDYIEAQEVVSEELGAFPGPVMDTDYLSINGILSHYERQSMKTASNTICSFATPTATSTLDFFGWNIKTATSVDAQLSLATSTNAYATSTSNELFADRVVSANTFDTTAWQTAGAGINDNLLTPGKFVVVRAATTTTIGYTFGGDCLLKTTEIK